MSSTEAPVVVAALRTPIGTAGGTLSSVTAADLAAPVLAGCRRRVARPAATTSCSATAWAPAATSPGSPRCAPGWPVDVPALTVDRQCGSGLAALDVAAAMLRAAPGWCWPAGSESASTAPLRFWPGDPPRRYDRAPFAPEHLGDPDMGLAADLLAEKAGVSRERQDAYAARSHALAAATRDAGGFDAEVVATTGVTRDERPRAGLTPARLARLRPAFRPADEGGTVTAGNACGVNDGAAAVVLVDAATHRRLDVPGLRVLATATAGVDPALPGLGLVPAVERRSPPPASALDDLDAIELNEAFAGQVLACCDALALDPDRVCVEGGAHGARAPLGRVGRGARRPALLAAGAAGARALRPGGDRRRRRPGRRDGGRAMPHDRGPLASATVRRPHGARARST